VTIFVILLILTALIQLAPSAKIMLKLGMKQISAVVCTILAETSPQALPLGAACVVSAIKNRFLLQNIQNENPFELLTSLCVLSMEKKPEAHEIARKILETKPLAVCLSLFVWNRPLLEKAAHLIKKQWKNDGIEGFIICGGPEVTADPASFFTEEYILSDNEYLFDFLVSGTGEKAVPDLLEKVFSPAFNHHNLTMDKRIVYGGETDHDVSASPYLDHTLDPDEYGGALWELARGCPFKCSYCYESKGSKKVVYFPMERIRQEIDFFAEKKVSQIFVLDPTYNADVNRALTIISLIKEKLSGSFFHFECRAEFITTQLAKAFASIPCSLQIGLQSSNEKVLALVNRPFNTKEFKRKIALLNESGAVFGFDLIYGLPGDTLAGFMESINYAVSLYPNHLELFRLSVLPGTDLHDRAQELGLSYDVKPPYLVHSTPSFSEQDLFKAEKTAQACNVFYSQGRAVSWFIAVVKPLKMNYADFFKKLAQYLENKPLQSCPSLTDIEKMQKDFVKTMYTEKKLLSLLPWAEDIISLYGALSRYDSDGTDSTLSLRYSAQSLLDVSALDGAEFCRLNRTGRYSITVSKLN